MKTDSIRSHSSHDVSHYIPVLGYWLLKCQSLSLIGLSFGVGESSSCLLRSNYILRTLFLIANYHKVMHSSKASLDILVCYLILCEKRPPPWPRTFEKYYVKVKEASLAAINSLSLISKCASSISKGRTMAVTLYLFPWPFLLHLKTKEHQSCLIFQRIHFRRI